MTRSACTSKEIGRCPFLPPKKKLELAKRMEMGDKQAKSRLIGSELAPCGVHRQAICRARDAVSRPYPGRQHGPHQGR